MAASRSTTSLGRRRHADRPAPWAQFPWTLLGMAFITALFLASYQLDGTTAATVEIDTKVPHAPATR